jgi:hypothetical protein
VFEASLAWWAFPLFFVVAMLYGSVGHGGASGYLALFALLGVAQSGVVPIALMLNTLVAGLGWFIYMRRGFFSVSLLLPFVIGSVPAAFLGGRIQLSATAFGLVLGATLVLAALRMLFLREVRPVSNITVTRQRQVWSMVIGVILGFLAGMVGIGGGVFLSPILLFLKWADAKQTAAVSSAFIVLNSLSGLAGHFLRGSVPTGPMVLLGGVVLAGGLAGSYAGSRHVRPLYLQTLLGVVLLIAGGKLLLPLWR